MSRRGHVRCGRTLIGAVLVVVGLAGFNADPVGATGVASHDLVAGVSSHDFGGINWGVSCLSTKLCVAYGYNAHGVGDVVAARNGVPMHVSTIHGSQGVFDVSCPSSKGCVAIDRTGNDVGTEFSTINASGIVTRSVRIKTPAGVNLAYLDCRSLTSCEVAGTDVFASPQALRVASWNGHRLGVFHGLKGFRGATSVALDGFSCHGSSCVLVGFANGDKLPTVGFTAIAHNGHLSTLRRVKSDLLNGVACVSAARCYAVGTGRLGGVVLTLNNGAVSHIAELAPGLQNIACHGRTCTATGKENAPAGAPTNVFYYGVIVAVTAGVPGAIEAFAGSSGYYGASRGTAGFFAVAGSSQHGASVLTTS